MRDKNVILAITGSIAAYKSAILTRSLIKAGCNVRILMTEAAKGFVAPLTFSTLSKQTVLSDIFTDEGWNNHVELGLWADAMVIAPATANTISKCANGQADNLVVATYLSARCPVFFAPAMDLDMWQHGSTKDNLDKLIRFGNKIIPVGHGELASGLTGDGRMAEPETIVEYLERLFEENVALKGKRVMVTAGPTHESIDPVRYIGNRSTGTMGVEIAQALARRGAHVDLVLGPTAIEPDQKCHTIRVTSAAEMHDAAMTSFEKADIAVLAAAVADFTPAAPSDSKIKKDNGAPSIELARTKDIAGEMSKVKREDQFVVGFALETDNELENAREKLTKKKFDFIVLNSLRDKGAGFGTATNKVKFVFPDNDTKEFELKTKAQVAEDIVDEIVNRINRK